MAPLVNHNSRITVGAISALLYWLTRTQKKLPSSICIPRQLITNNLFLANLNITDSFATAWTIEIVNPKNLQPRNLLYAAAIPLFACLMAEACFSGNPGQTHIYPALNVLVLGMARYVVVGSKWKQPIRCFQFRNLKEGGRSCQDGKQPHNA